MTKGNLLSVIILLTALIGACDGQDQAKKKPKPQLDETATVLPPGVRTEWFETLDRAIDKRLVIYKGRVRLGGSFSLEEFSGEQYVPIGQIAVECGDPLFGIGLSAGYGEERAELSLVGGMLIGIYGGEEAPDLKGISSSSPAAKKLFDELCRHLINRLDQLKLQSENR